MMKIQEKKMIKPHLIQETVNKFMSISLWKDLPPEVLENVLACLPTHVLCRFRLVCKKWNHLFSQPRFVALCTLSSHRASSIVIFSKVYTRIEWQVLDPTEKHSYKLSDSFIKDSYVSPDKNQWFKRTLAADGEFIYTMYYTGPRTKMHIVCNLVNKSFHEIPELEILGSPGYYYNIVVMSKDKATQTYKIVTTYSTTPKPKGHELFFLYESTTSTWRKLCDALDVEFSINSCIFMKGIFYTLFVHKCHTTMLYSCDLVTGAWSKVGVDFPPLTLSSIKEHLQLVVSLGRLYMVKYPRNLSLNSKLSIWKIVVETKEVLQLEESEISSILYDTNIFLENGVSWMSDVVGCVDSIIFLIESRRNVRSCMKFNLLEKRWQELQI